jgi:mono/diheme cytochrome c family protein
MRILRKPRFAGVVVIGVVLAGPGWIGVARAQTPAERGQQVYTESKCFACHAVAGKGNAKGPLDGVGTKLPAAEIRDWITNAPAMAAKAKAQRKPPMRAFPNLVAADVDAIVAYLQTLKQ